MKPTYYRYELWEDYRHGMYRTSKDGKEDERIALAVDLFNDLPKLQEEMQYVADNWVYSAATKLSDTTNNHQSWLGQAALCNALGCSKYETINAWWLLTDEQRKAANRIADIVFEKWKRNYEKTSEGYQYSIFDFWEATWQKDIYIKAY